LPGDAYTRLMGTPHDEFLRMANELQIEGYGHEGAGGWPHEPLGVRWREEGGDLARRFPRRWAVYGNDPMPFK
jgi:hypothetical protein